MSRPRTSLIRNGVGASSVTLPNHGPWASVLAFLIDRFPSVGAEAWQRRFEEGLVLDADGLALDIAHPFRGQARVHYFRDLVHEVPVPFDAPILFQDEYLVVADKPHFLSVMPAGRYVQETLLVRLKRATGIDTLTPMHRIDRETAGVVVFVIRPDTRGAYQSLFHEHRVRKVYEAIAPLPVAQPNGDLRSLEFPLRYAAHLRESDNFMQMEVVAGAPNSETLIDLIDSDTAHGLGHYRLQPISGRKHQLRAHMNALGLPIINDSIYPVHQPAAPDDFSRPLQLLAKSIAFDDPISGAARQFESARSLR